MSTPGPLVTELTTRTLIAPGIADLSFKMVSPAELSFRAGQFVSIAVDGPDAPSPSRRSYSIASQSDAGGTLRFIIRVIPSGAASELLMSTPIGGTMRMTGPHGFFVLDAEHAGDVVFGATGTGIAAVMPMLGELARRTAGRGRRRVVLWGLRQESDIFARAEIEELAARSDATLEIFLTAPNATWTGARGRITPVLLERLPTLSAPTFYLVGNGAMITEVKRELVARGVNRKTQIRTEAFFD